VVLIFSICVVPRCLQQIPQVLNVFANKFSITPHFVLDALPDVSEYWDLICLEKIFLY
jgi:hypothetical protein